MLHQKEVLLLSKNRELARKHIKTLIKERVSIYSACDTETAQNFIDRHDKKIDILIIDVDENETELVESFLSVVADRGILVVDINNTLGNVHCRISTLSLTPCSDPNSSIALIRAIKQAIKQDNRNRLD